MRIHYQFGLWAKTLTIEEAIQLILREAISRAGLEGAAAEWRAGCPVSGNFAYREALVSALDDLGCEGKVKWITEEPLLPFAFGDALGVIQDGSFLVYDMGGGSFDCAIVHKSGKELTVYAQEDLPTLGGMDIDDKLKEMKGYYGPIRDLRETKEQLYSGGTAKELNITDDGAYTLSRADVEEVLDEGKFMQKTLIAMLDAYKKAKLLWKRPEGENVPPYGEMLEGGKSVWSLNVEDMAEDIDYVLVVGGPTRIPHFSKQLKDVFGDDKVITADDLVLTADRSDIDNAALTALSHGACYMYGSENENRYTPLTVDRIPAKITLSVTDGQSTIVDICSPFERLPIRPPIAPYQGRMIFRRAINEGESTILDPTPDSTYSVLIEDADGNTMYDYGPEEMRMPRDGHRADRIKLIVDRLGSVWVELGAGFTDVPKTPHLTGIVPIVRHPVWQTDAQKKIIDDIRDEQRRYRERQADITRRNVMGHPWEYPF